MNFENQTQEGKEWMDRRTQRQTIKAGTTGKKNAKRKQGRRDQNRTNVKKTMINETQEAGKWSYDNQTESWSEMNENKETGRVDLCEEEKRRNYKMKEGEQDED